MKSVVTLITQTFVVTNVENQKDQLISLYGKSTNKHF